ncbi:nicotinate-nucleotide diphosphorylase (carboxylating) [Didymella glomerata]|uniref:Nicotinate-nucleotide diphosphorylase (Carboxylating) n=1 Tax=Didymella glomerata TaxID=749621 RepID=A0A9W8WUB2_9PLEO|nr:nicotinate-nucleotide diphosphorylase (carboxylating) [Didymella glomerata]
MRTSLVSTTVLATILPALAAAQSDTYHLTEDLSYTNFFSAFNFFSGPDPTQGFVQYQNATSAVQKNLIGYFTDPQSVYIGVDHSSKDPAGRPSVRLESKKGWNSGLLVADIRHMPASTCGTWPAYWLVGSDAEMDGNITWPDAGEIDILEGVNDYTTNSMTLHTSAGCMVDNSTSGGTGSDNTSPPFTGHLKTDNCDVAAPNQGENEGCSISAPLLTPPMHKRSPSGIPRNTNTLASYGTPFNLAGGGIYALELSPQAISIWLIPRTSPQYTTLFPTPASSTFLTTTLSASALGVPIARFTGQCDVARKFRNMKIVFDTTFCGSWAGGEWESGGCAAKTGVSTCEAYVRDHPEAFVDAYWEIAGLKWFQKEDVRTVPVQKKAVPMVKGQGWFGW